MATKIWTLFDHSTGDHAGHSFQASGSDVGGSADLRVHLEVGQSGLSRGVEQLVVSNGKLRFVILPTRGMSLWKAWYLGEQEEHIGWRSPVRGPVHPCFVPLTEPSGLGWLDGFDELLVRCGLESNGAPEFDENNNLQYVLHGRIGNKPAYKLQVQLDGENVTVIGSVEETRFHFLKVRMQSTFRTSLNSTSIDIEDQITNLSASSAEIQMLYHVNFGQPLLDGGSQVIAPIREVVPRNDHAASGIDNWNSYAAEIPGYEEQVYFATCFGNDAGETSALLKNAHGTRGAVLRYNVNHLPCLSVWKNTTSEEDGYVTGIEPGTNYPNPRSFEGQHGRVIKLDGNQSVSLELGLDYCHNEASVNQAEAAIQALQKQAPKIHRAPQPTWCA